MFLVDRGVDERPARPAGDGLATSAECGDELMIFRLKKTCLDNHARVDGEESTCLLSLRTDAGRIGKYLT